MARTAAPIGSTWSAISAAGTFDVAVVDVEDGIFEGARHDRRCLPRRRRHRSRRRREPRARCSLVARFDISTDTIAVERLSARRPARQARAVGGRPARTSTSRSSSSCRGQGVEYGRAMRRDELELWSAPLIRRLDPPIREALARCGRKPEDIQEVLLVGGSTRMPAVRREIRPRGRPRAEGDPEPEEVVATRRRARGRPPRRTTRGILLTRCRRPRADDVPRHGECETGCPRARSCRPGEHRVFATRQDDQIRISSSDVGRASRPIPASNRHLGRYAVVDSPNAARAMCS